MNCIIQKKHLRLALENDLTIMGTSDIHGLIDWLFKVPDDNESSNGTYYQVIDR